MNLIPKYYCLFIKEMTGWVMTARMIREKMNLRYFSIDDSGISMRKKDRDIIMRKTSFTHRST